MQKTFQYFMWPYQELFRAVRHGQALSLFDALAPGLEPQLFLIGFLADKRDDRHPICVHPEDEFWLSPDSLAGVSEDASRIRKDYPDANTLQSLREAAARHASMLDRRSLKDATVECLNNHPEKPSGSVFFASLPMRVEGFDVLVVLSLNERAINSYPRLQASQFWIHQARSQYLARSLIESVVEVFLRECSNDLDRVSPGEGSLGGSETRILQDAAKEMFANVVMRCDTCQNTLGAYAGAFDNVVRIASLGYEKAEAAGTIVFARLDHEAVEYALRFQKEIPLKQHRHIRKLLEVTRTGDMKLLTNSAACPGFVQVDEGEALAEDLFEITFQKKYVWDCRHSGRILFKVDNGVPYLDHPTLDKARVGGDMRRVLPELQHENETKILELIDEATKQDHGTVVIVTADAESESQRLKSESTVLVPAELQPDAMKAVTAIDGAVLLGVDGRCFAIGAILDGKASDQGDPSRGARYNSVVRYLSSNDGGAFGVVVSEDGTVDTIPRLRPAIRRSEIDTWIRDLVSISELEIIPDRYRSHRMWFGQHRFYLSQTDCDTVNEIFTRLDPVWREQSDSSVVTSIATLKPDPEMREDWYYLPESPED